MKNLAGFTLLTGIIVLASLWSQLRAEHDQNAEIFKVRQLMIESFARLDLNRIIEQNSEYLGELKAGYDRDNQNFFIETSVVDSQYQDSSLLILISYPRPDEAEICLYAPEQVSWQWLRSRVRRTTTHITAPLVFVPMQQASDLVPFKIPVAINLAVHKPAGKI